MRKYLTEFALNMFCTHKTLLQQQDFSVTKLQAQGRWLSGILGGVAFAKQQPAIIDFVEKPEDPLSSIISTGIYLIPSKDLGFIAEYMAEGNNADAPGYFMQWLILKTDVYAHVFSGRWFDIGQFDQYNSAIDYFAEKK